MIHEPIVICVLVVLALLFAFAMRIPIRPRRSMRDEIRRDNLREIRVAQVRANTTYGEASGQVIVR